MTTGRNMCVLSRSGVLCKSRSSFGECVCARKYTSGEAVPTFLALFADVILLPAEQSVTVWGFQIRQIFVDICGSSCIIHAMLVKWSAGIGGVYLMRSYAQFSGALPMFFGLYTGVSSVKMGRSHTEISFTIRQCFVPLFFVRRTSVWGVITGRNHSEDYVHSPLLCAHA